MIFCIHFYTLYLYYNEYYIYIFVYSLIFLIKIHQKESSVPLFRLKKVLCKFISMKNKLTSTFSLNIFLYINRKDKYVSFYLCLIFKFKFNSNLINKSIYYIFVYQL